jgi:NifB/MoaA-like Fe-S oxidoreductase
VQWVSDVLAYRRELERGEATLEARDPAAGAGAFEVAWEDPGLEFDDVIFDGLRLCANKCEFCYVHQMPKGFRKSLYVMDDDYRTSFLYGSFVTLTNLTEDDVRRILDEHLSPLYVSVHTADEDLRRDMMKWWRLKVKDPRATSVRGMIERLEPIDLFTQVVAVPGRNDGEALDATLAYLASRPNVQAVAVVPVGLTGHRRNLPAVRTFTEPAEATPWWTRSRRSSAACSTERGSRFAFLSDEFYLVAGRRCRPPRRTRASPCSRTASAWCATSSTRSPGRPARGACRAVARALRHRPRCSRPCSRGAGAAACVAGLELEVRPLVNRTFGAVTTVTGLLAGRDVLTQVAPGEADLLLSRPSMLKYGTETLLDDRTLDDLRRELRMRVEVGGTHLGELVATILVGTATAAAAAAAVRLLHPRRQGEPRAALSRPGRAGRGAGAP